MSKKLDFDSKAWPGSVTIASPLNFPQYAAFGEAWAKARDSVESYPRYLHALLPGVLACVEKWDLANFPKTVTPDTFPATPFTESSRLMALLIREIAAQFRDADEAPNA